MNVKITTSTLYKLRSTRDLNILPKIDHRSGVICMAKYLGMTAMLLKLIPLHSWENLFILLTNQFIDFYYIIEI